MDELRKKHIVQIIFKDKSINGFVVDYTADRVMVLVAKEFLTVASEIKELDEVEVLVYTHLGLKKMKSSVISEINNDNCIVIENTPSYPVEQKREFARVLSTIKFNVIKKDNVFNCNCVNISAGGVAFFCDEANFKIGETIKIKFFERDFGRDIICTADIVKSNGNNFAAKYQNLSGYDEDRIVKHVFNLMVKE